MLAFSSRCWLSALWIAALCCSGGCTTAKKYRLVKENTAPLPLLGWEVSGDSATLAVRHVIVFKGPGSWKREARWDEYVVHVGNTGPRPLTLEHAELIDVRGTPQVPGVNPWALEKLSRTNWDRYGKTGLKLLAGAGAVVVYAGAVTSASIGSLLAGGAASGSVAALNAIPVVFLVNVGVVAGLNHSNKLKVEKEFARRRMELPVEIGPGATREGSLFFPLTPGPQALLLKFHRGDERFDLRLPLPALARLHLQPDGDKPERRSDGVRR